MLSVTYFGNSSSCSFSVVVVLKVSSAIEVVGSV